MIIRVEFHYKNCTFEKKNIANNFLLYTEIMIYFQVDMPWSKQKEIKYSYM